MKMVFFFFCRGDAYSLSRVIYIMEKCRISVQTLFSLSKPEKYLINVLENILFMNSMNNDK